MANDQITRFFGGSPAMVLLRLVILCVVVGVILAAIGLDPRNILDSLIGFLRGLYDLGFGAIERVWRYFLLGAVVVIPLWLLLRLFNGFGR